MDAGFMFTYAFGAPLAGQLGDMYDPSMILGVGLYGSAACIFMLIFGMWNHLGESGPFIANTYFLGVYLVFGFFFRRSEAPSARRSWATGWSRRKLEGTAD